MAGAMRRMGIYLGLVEDDDTRAYGRYDARSSEALDHDRRYGRYADERYDDYADPAYAGDDYPRGGYAGEELAPAEPVVRDPEPLSVRRVAPRTLGLAPAGASSGPVGGRVGGMSSGMSSGPVAAAGLAMREPVAEPEPEPEPAPVAAPVAKSYRITTLHPRTYNEARTIGERFREGMPVIMNLSEMDDADAKRLVDFAAGLSFGLRGSIERVTAKVFLISPQDVAVTAEDKAKIREGGFSDKS
jgi:cell division inhibitor SepF